MKVLVVDDDAAVRNTIEQLLVTFGHSVAQVEDGRQALEFLRKETVDFVICDWNMPGLNGIDLLKTLRADTRTADLPFIMITSPGTDEVRKIEEAVGAKVDAYVVKPFRGETLNTKITEVLSRKSLSPEGKGVLVVDDDEQVRKIIVEILEMLGHAPIFQAEDGVAALELLQAHLEEIGLVISDWEMPKMAGIKLLKKIRSDRRISDLPFLMVTSQTSIEHVKLKEAIHSHVSHYLIKPFTAKDLESKINLVLSRSKSERDMGSKIEKARHLVSDGQIEEARSLFRDVIKRDPRNIAAHLELADTYLQDEPDPSIEEAFKLIRKVIQMDPGQDIGYIALALAFEHARSLDKAIQILQDAGVQIPASASIFYQLGRLNVRRGHPEAAMEALQKALAIKPDFPEASELLKGLSAK